MICSDISDLFKDHCQERRAKKAKETMTLDPMTTPPGSRMSTGSVKTPVLEGLDSHNDKMQVDAFNKACRSGGKGIGRMLGFGKGGDSPAD